MCRSETSALIFGRFGSGNTTTHISHLNIDVAFLRSSKEKLSRNRNYDRAELLISDFGDLSKWLITFTIHVFLEVGNSSLKKNRTLIVTDYI